MGESEEALRTKFQKMSGSFPGKETERSGEEGRRACSKEKTSEKS